MPGIREMEMAAEQAAQAHDDALRAYRGGFPYASSELQEKALASCVSLYATWR